MLPSSTTGTTPSIIDKIKAEIVQPLIVLLVAVAVGYFLYGLMEFLRDRDSDEMQTSGKQHMLWGIIGLAIIFSVFGILGLINSTVGGLTP